MKIREVVELKDINLLDLGNTIQISGMMMSDGTGKTLLIPLPDEVIGPLTVLALSNEDWKTFLRQTDILEVEVLMDDKSGLKKAILRKSTRQIDQRVSWEVYRRDNYKCRYCGRDNVPLTVDHIILWEDGGPSIEDNLTACCKRCNKLRGNMKYDQWLESKEYFEVSRGRPGLPPETLIQNHELQHCLEHIPIKLHSLKRKSAKDKKRHKRNRQ